MNIGSFFSLQWGPIVLVVSSSFVNNEGIPEGDSIFYFYPKFVYDVGTLVAFTPKSMMDSLREMYDIPDDSRIILSGILQYFMKRAW